MNYLQKIVLILVLVSFAVGSVQAQKKKRKKTATEKKTTSKKKSSNAGKTAVAKPVQPKEIKSAKVTKLGRSDNELSTQISKEGLGDTSSPKMVTITSAFKPFLKNAAKVNFTAATPVIDSSKIPVVYSIPSQSLFFNYQPVAIKPLALAVDSGYVWENDQYIKLGAGNFSSFYGEAALSFGDGKTSITNVRGNFLTSTGNLPAQQAAKWGIDILSIFNTGNNHEWTTHPFYQSNTQYLYGYQPSTLPYQKETLLQRFTTVGIEAGMQNKAANSFGITYHHEIYENSFLVKAPINKAFGKIYAFDLGLTADISSAYFPLIPNPLTIRNNLFYINPSIQFETPNFKLNAGIQPSWDNQNFSMLPNVTVEAKIADANLVLQAGWIGSFQKNTYRSFANFNPWIGTSFSSLLNTRINEQYAGIKASSGDHFTYQVKASLLSLTNQPLFLNNTTDGKTFNVVYEPEMKAFRLHGEMGYTEQEKISFTAGATFTSYNSLTVNQKVWGLLPLEATASLKWKLMKGLQLKSDLFVWDGAPYRDKALLAQKASAAADLNLGAEFSVMPRLNVWLQMNNVLNSKYQRWNQYSVLGFNVLGGVVYSFR
jgi:hypothetical protein